MIVLFGSLFGENPTKESVNHVLNVKRSRTFRRSVEDFSRCLDISDKIPVSHFSIILENVVDIITYYPFSGTPQKVLWMMSI